MASENDKPVRQLGGELVIPVLAIVFTIYFFTTIWNSPWTAQVSAFFVGGVLIFVSALFILRSVIWIRQGDGSLGFANLFNRGDIQTGRIGLLVTTVGFCVLIERLGFTLTTFLFLSLSMIILSKGRRPVFITMIAAAMALGGWAVFIWAFDTRFPHGWFEDFMKAVLANG
ncbi:tripartite tricarboxylate transporter TctB family protein [bacterium]|nr:tripartite tricarboxylate transporter TctB family protein [bacterium]